VQLPVVALFAQVKVDAVHRVLLLESLKAKVPGPLKLAVDDPVSVIVCPNSGDDGEAVVVAAVVLNCTNVTATSFESTAS
jgi:hypothetical protein